MAFLVYLHINLKLLSGKKTSKSKQTKYSGFVKLGVRWAERDITCEYNSLSLEIYTLVNNDYVVVSSQAQMTATVILLPGVLGECLAVLIVLWLLLQLSGQQILPQLATAQ